MKLELDLALLKKLLEQLKTKPMEATLRKLVDWGPETLAAILLIGFAQELAHDQLSSLCGWLTLVCIDAMQLFLVLNPLPPTQLKSSFWHGRKW